MESESSSLVKTTEIILHALENQPGNEAEILQLLLQLPSITSTYLPYDFNRLTQKRSDGVQDTVHVRMVSILEILVKWLMERLKSLFHVEQKDVIGLTKLSKGQIARICESIEHLAVLGGHEFASQKLRGVLSKCVDLALQRNMEYIADVLPHMKQVQENFTALVNDIRVIAFDANKIIFLCRNFHLTLEQQMDLISDPILEKLSIELLTLVDALKEGVLKQYHADAARSSISSTNLFSTLTTKIAEDAVFSHQELAYFSCIVEQFLSLETALHNCTYTKLLKEKSNVEHGKKSALKHRSQLPDLLRSSQQSSLIRSSQTYGQWNWEEIIKDIRSIIIGSLGKVLDHTQEDEINTARNIYHKDNSCNLVTVPSISSSLFATNSGMPQKCISCFGEILKQMKILLPLAVLGSQYRPLSALYSQYVDECGQALKSMKSFLMTIMNDVPSKGPVSNLYFVLATCEDVCTILTYCASKMQNEPRIPFQGILQLYKDLNNTVRNTIVQHISGRLSAYVLHDADSNHWSDPHEFNESECCSYPVQMWNLLLQQLWFELGSCVSEVQRHRIFTEVFRNSCKLFSQRYTQCEPSYNRVKQVRLDITAILTICRSFFLRLDFHPNRIFPADVEWAYLDIKHTSSEILVACQNLLSVMTVVTSPLEDIQKSLCRIVQDTGRLGCCPEVNWLHVIHPSMFGMNWNGSFSHLTDKAAVLCSIHFISIHPSQSLIHCLFSLTMRRFFLLKKILSGKLKLQTGGEIPLQDEIFMLFSSCSHDFQEVFYKCASKTVKQDVKVLLKACCTYDTDMYPWQRPFFSSLLPCICKSLLRVGTYIHNLTWSTMGCNVLSTLPVLQQRQIMNLSEPGNPEYVDNCILVCMILILQGICQCIYILPGWMTTFLSHVNKDYGVASDLAMDDPALHILTLAAHHILNSCEMWEEQLGMDFRREGLEFMEKVSNCFLSMCKDEKLPRGNRSIQDVFLHELQKLKVVAASTFSEQPKGKDVEDTDDQLLEECCSKVQSLRTSGCSKAVKSLERISNLLTLSENDICSQWGLNTYLQTRSIARNEETSKNTQSLDTFDAISAYSRIGEDFFDHDALMDFPWNWEQLFQNFLHSLDRNSLIYLLEHRWEMKENALLQGDEQDIVEKIQSAIPKL